MGEPRFVQHARAFLEIAEEVPGMIEQAHGWAKRVSTKAAKGERSYERTHGGRAAEPAETVDDAGTKWETGFPDPRTGVTVMGRLSSISYLTDKGEGEGGITEYQHCFGRGARTEQCSECGSHVRVGAVNAKQLPELGYTFDEHPSGLVVARAKSAYKVTARGIEG
jgi:hypothetical protein